MGVFQVEALNCLVSKFEESLDSGLESKVFPLSDEEVGDVRDTVATSRDEPDLID